MRPFIGITVNFRNDGEMEFSRRLGYPEQKWQALCDDYIEAVQRAGGIPVMLPVLRGDGAAEAAKELCSRLDGILFSGGCDVDPQRYGERTTGRTGELVPERDEQEILLFRYVLKETDLPVLGICRGLQVVNVALGGTLLEDVQAAGHPSHTLHMYPRTEASHRVEVAEGSLLSTICGAGELPVNSLHHMAIKDCAPSLKAVALSDDGLTEAVELKDPAVPARFFLAVQWHPEMMSSKDPLQQGIISAFVASCRK